MIKRWWNGTYVPFKNKANDRAYLIGGTQEFHWTARVARAVVGFLLREWKWVIGTLLAVVGLAMTYARFFQAPP